MENNITHYRLSEKISGRSCRGHPVRSSFSRQKSTTSKILLRLPRAFSPQYFTVLTTRTFFFMFNLLHRITSILLLSTSDLSKEMIPFLSTKTKQHKPKTKSLYSFESLHHSINLLKPILSQSIKFHLVITALSKIGMYLFIRALPLEKSIQPLLENIKER